MVSSERGKKKRKFYFSVCDELGTKKNVVCQNGIEPRDFMPRCSPLIEPQRLYGEQDPLQSLFKTHSAYC